MESRGKVTKIAEGHWHVRGPQLTASSPPWHLASSCGIEPFDQALSALSLQVDFMRSGEVHGFEYISRHYSNHLSPLLGPVAQGSAHLACDILTGELPMGGRGVLQVRAMTLAAGRLTRFPTPAFPLQSRWRWMMGGTCGA